MASNVFDFYTMMPEFLQQLFSRQTYRPDNFFLIAGPCVVESEELVMEVAEKLASLGNEFGIPCVFKASYRKANRTSAHSFTGIGDEKALSLIQKAGQTFGLPTTSDIHTAEEATMAAAHLDILQIPAFLCRQTDLLQAAAATGKIVNIKKGQFLSGPSMKFAVEKIRQSGNNRVMLTERGNTFGYQDLVVDYRNIPWMQAHAVPVIMDCTHSLQQPNQQSGVTGGNPQLIGTIAKAAIAVGAEGLFIETHPNPAVAKSDGANMLALEQLPVLLEQLVRIREAIK
jgi:2-dehydro-3-deoxyphosphooctonate aldolase (KDO 8-P synthase)